MVVVYDPGHFERFSKTTVYNILPLEQEEFISNIQRLEMLFTSGQTKPFNIHVNSFSKHVHYKPVRKTRCLKSQTCPCSNQK